MHNKIATALAAGFVLTCLSTSAMAQRPLPGIGRAECVSKGYWYSNRARQCFRTPPKWARDSWAKTKVKAKELREKAKQKLEKN